MGKLCVGKFFLFFTFAIATHTSGCFEHERGALLRFKRSLIVDPSRLLSSWNGNNCCLWPGVGCDNATGYVTKLHLGHLPRRETRLEYNELNSSLAELTHLTKLRLLNLSSMAFTGIVPQFIGNMSNLRVLDLSNSELVIDDFTWFSSLLSLKYLGLTGLSVAKAPNIDKVLLCMISSLQELRLTFCDLSSSHLHLMHLEPNLSLPTIQKLDLSSNLLRGKFPLFLQNLTSLRFLDLSYNELTGTIPVALGNLIRLQELDLSMNKLAGSIPTSIGNLTLLQKLRLSSNMLNGTIPISLGQLSNLEYLSLHDNRFSALPPLSLENLTELRSLSIFNNLLQGPLPTSIGRLSKLYYLYIFNNSLSGVVTEAHFANASMLEWLDASSNYGLSFNISPDWTPPFQLISLELGSCKIESEFPRWIRTQTRLSFLTLSNTSIYGPLPDWLGELLINRLDLSHNFLNGPLTNMLCNQTTKSLTTYYDGVYTSLLLKDNLFNGSIPDSLCNVTDLAILDLSRNMLSGTLPQCFGNLQNLRVLILSSNRLSGVIPSSLGNLGSSLQCLALNNNIFHGELPKNLANCTGLALLDLGENRLSGSIPKWVGDLMILRLHRNNFTGPFPVECCEGSLQIMDLGENKLTGTIPRCFHNLRAMTGGDSTIVNEYMITTFTSEFEESLNQVIKGVMLEYTTTFIFVVNMDLSSNKLVGEIPKELVILSGLLGLNLSNNHLTGRIPDRIGDMSSLMSLDLSSNNLSGMIPESVSALTFLSHLNLSHNNLSGRIPTGSQLQTLIDPSIYAGNNKLCGSPLTIKRTRDEVPETGRNTEEDEDDNGVEKIWIYGVTSGFTTGFMGIVGILVLKNRWRRAFFKFVGYYIGKKL